MTDESRATFTLRASRELLDRLKQAADEHSHSMNAEIIRRLEESIYLSRSATALVDGELNDAERALVALWRRMDEEQRRSWLLLLERGLNSSSA